MELSFAGLALSLGVLLLGGFWWDSLRTREIATQLCDAACHNQGVQLLDQTVALQHLTLCQAPQGLRLRRTYRFDFSLEGIGRHSGYLVMRGQTLALLNLDLSTAYKNLSKSELSL